MTFRAWVLLWAEQFAANRRAEFDTRGPGVTVRKVPLWWVAAWGVVTGIVGAIGGIVSSGGCKPLPFSIIDLELTFSTPAFTALLKAADTCGAHLGWGLLVDCVFLCVYPWFLCALYLWAERYIRCTADDDPQPLGTPRPLSAVIACLPFVAAAFDLLENIGLWLGMWAAPDGASLSLWVWCASIAAALKFSALAFFLLGFLGIVLRGPRGRVIWRLRFSVLAVAVGSLALLAIPQGQDILQRLVEGAHPIVRVLITCVFIGVMGSVVWYSARVLTLVQIRNDPKPYNAAWLEYFEVTVPRVLGVAALGLTGAAFARAALALVPFVITGVLSFLIVQIVTKYRAGVFGWIGAGVLGFLRADATVWIQANDGRRMEHQRQPDDELTKDAGIMVFGMVMSLLAAFPQRLWNRWPFIGAPLMPRGNDLQALRIGGAAMLAITWFLYYAFYHRLQLLSLARNEAYVPDVAEQARRAKYETPNALPADVKRVIAIAAVLSIILGGIGAVSTVDVPRIVGPVLVLAFGVSNAVFIGSLLVYHGLKYRLPLATLLIGFALLISRWNDNHPVRRVEKGIAPDTMHRAGRLDSAFHAWLAARAKEDTGRIPVVLVAASGGGLRAAYWTAMSLATLDDKTADRRFAHHVFAISGVSGGSLGGAVYASLVRERGTHGLKNCADHAPPGRFPDTTMTACVRGFMNDDFLSPVLARMMTGDAVQQILPVPVEWFDRSRGLEDSWEASYDATTKDSTFRRGFLELYTPDTAGVPILLLNATHVQTGRRYIIAPFVDDSAFLDSRSMHRVIGSDVPLSTAVHNSARFAYVSPAGRIERNDGKAYGAVVDGGYFENSGLTTIGDVRRQILGVLATAGKPAHSAWDSLATRVDLLVLYLCNNAKGCKHDVVSDSSLTAERALGNEWFSPLLTLIATRDARGSLARSDVLRAQQGTGFVQLNVCDSLGLVAADSGRLKLGRDRAVDPPLGWLLSSMARDWMDLSLGIELLPDSGKAVPAGGQCRVRNATGVRRILAAMSAAK